VDEQRELWLEMLPSDHHRVDDLGQVLDATAFFGSWWWGGSQVGMAPGHRMIGYQTGSTPGIVRASLVSGARAGDATTAVFAGRSGRGKTTAMMLMALDDTIGGNTATYWLSLKGDDLAVADVARAEGAAGGVVSVGGEHSGTADLFRSLGADDAILPVHRQLQLLTPPHLHQIAATTLLPIVERHAHQAEQPSTWGVIQELVHHEDPAVRELGGYLASLAQTPNGAPILGPWRGQEALPAEAGLWVVHFPNLTLPGREKPAASWDTSELVSVALIRAFVMHTLQVAASGSTNLAKLVCLPEVHRLLKTADGMDFLDQVARMGRALNANLAIDLQDLTSIEAHEGLVEQIRLLFVFQLSSEAQQDAAARLCHLPVTAHTRAMFWQLGLGSRPDEVVHGHCMMLDPSGRAGTVQITFPDDAAQAALSTTPDDPREEPAA